ncbi:hypothetical protein [Thalassospira sp. MCCC 1A01428]|uniref:hypothetical protein n=1 Tax=Thalassospira sp. MCCC 1A01428 TaxID=1470575 RepID=UPI000A1E08CE|nr:hypothetical protein [Thalassospira sp. MCCC 1A01428]OSQ39230.1 hypothetical protein THS27_21290 [Thalassospira sp. MCCC 1A01428]|tara:strand:- start:7555 stop:7836 length:282 start_codon:yes stop_codon:yes gene_type:complete
MSADVFTFPVRATNPQPRLIPIRKTIPAACLPAAGSSVMFYRDHKLCDGQVIVALPNGQILVKPDNGKEAGWITRRDLHTHSIFTPPPAPGAA